MVSNTSRRRFLRLGGTLLSGGLCGTANAQTDEAPTSLFGKPDVEIVDFDFDGGPVRPEEGDKATVEFTLESDEQTDQGLYVFLNLYHQRHLKRYSVDLTWDAFSGTYIRVPGGKTTTFEFDWTPHLDMWTGVYDAELTIDDRNSPGGWNVDRSNLPYAISVGLDASASCKSAVESYESYHRNGPSTIIEVIYQHTDGVNDVASACGDEESDGW